jgi:hypothetical protein
MIRLRRREKLLAAGLLTFVAVWSLFALAINPAFDRIETLNRVISEKQQELEDVREISKEFTYLNNTLDYLHKKVDSRQETFELLPFLESLIEECGLAGNFKTMKRQVLEIDSSYSEVIVEVRLESLPIGRLVDFLSKIDSLQAQVKTKSLYIKRNMANKNLLDVVIEVYNIESSQYEFARN